MRYLTLLATLMSTQAFAGEIPDLPITGKYAEAASKAQQAALIQSGVTGQIEQAKSMVGAYAVEKAKYYGLAKPLGAILYCARIYRDKAVSLPLDKETRVKVELNKVSLVINF